MATRTQKADKPATSVWRILAGVISLSVLIIYCFIHANFVTGRSLLLAFPGWEVTYRNCWPNPFGGAWVSDVTLMPFEGDEEDAFHFDHLTVDVPLIQYYRGGFRKKLTDRLDAIKEIRLEFSGGKSSMSWPMSDELFLLGNASASPFEAEGCLRDGVWHSDEFEDMGLVTEPTRLSMRWERSDDRLIKEQSIHTPGAGRVDYREEQVVHDEFPLFYLVETGENGLALTEWHVRDEGFVAARNNHCAKKDGISPAEFVERHLATVQRILAASGLEARETTMLAYRRFAESGGALDLVVNYTPPIDWEFIENANWESLQARATSEFTIDGQSERISMRAIRERPFAETDEDLTTFALLQREQARQTPLADEPEMPAAAAQPAAASTLDTLTAAEVEALMASDVETVERPGTIVDYRKLASETGRQFMLYVKGKKPLRVEVVGSENGVIKVRRHLRSGWLEYSVARAGFERAVPVR
ncbi:hypothetical protein [Dokdonella sp.]|uniref:hypothetical protein n=1 Tax=Dokdonella sp. TaxID=2291710 RepID=UPI003C3D3D61